MAKSDFLATMSHEIRTPMNGMMVMAELLSKASLPPRQKRYADVISKSGKSLLPAGVAGIAGHFARGDAVVIIDADGVEIGRGLSAYDSEEAQRIAGRRSDEIEAILGYSGRAAMVHRDDLVMRE